MPAAPMPATVPVVAATATPTVAAPAPSLPSAAPVADATSVGDASSVSAAGAALRIALDTVLIVETEQLLSSRTLKRGDKFALRLAEPLLIDGVQVLPAGLSGMGEVVHAERSRTGGKAGELILAARYLEYQRQRIALRGFRIGASGSDRTVGSLAVAMAVGVVGILVRGGEIEIPAQTRGQARVNQDTELSAPIIAAAVMPAPAASVSPHDPSSHPPSGEVVQ